MLALTNRFGLGLALLAIAVVGVVLLARLPWTARVLRGAAARVPDADPSLDVRVPPVVGRLAAVALVAIVLAGGTMRLVQLDRQIFWDDEVWTALRIAGTSDKQIADLYDGRTLTVAQIEAKIHARASSFAPVVTSLATSEPQWPPLYYLLEWLWSAVAGTSPEALRALAAIFGAALAPAVYWLGIEIFRARAPAWFAASLVALSPAEIVYAREARGYSLLLLITALSMSLLLTALRTRRAAFWYGFALLSILGLYDYLLYLPILAGQLAYVFIIERFRWTESVRAAAIAASVAVAAFAPWIAICALGRRAMAAGLPLTSPHYSPSFYAAKALLNIGLSFFATTYFDLAVAPVAVATALFALLCAWRTARSAPRATIALACLALPTVFFIGAWDIVRNQHLLLIYRYETAAWLALQLAVAGGLTWGISHGSRAARGVWTALAATLLIVCGTSSALAVGEPTFWDSWYEAGTPQIASIVNALPHPYILVDHDSDNIFTFAGDLRPDVRVRLSKWNDYSVPPSPSGPAQDVLLLTATPVAPRGPRGAPLRRLYTFDAGTSLVVRLRRRYHFTWLIHGRDPLAGADTLWTRSPLDPLHRGPGGT